MIDLMVGMLSLYSGVKRRRGVNGGEMREDDEVQVISALLTGTMSWNE